jgi:hypothetical protein
MRRLTQIALIFFTIYMVLERRLIAILPGLSFMVLMLYKALSYKESHPHISLTRRFCWLFFRIFLCGFMYNTFVGQFTLRAIVKQLPSFIAIVLILHVVNDKLIQKYYTNSPMFKVLLGFQYSVGSARGFISGASFLYSFYKDNYALFLFIFIFTESHPTDLCAVVEKVVHNKSRNLITKGHIIGIYKYVLLFIASTLYFRWTVGANWRRVTFDSMHPVDRLYR